MGITRYVSPLYGKASAGHAANSMPKKNKKNTVSRQFPLFAPPEILRGQKNNLATRNETPEPSHFRAL
ncbi:MAG: hypothetical protein FJZ79_08800 [Chlorobi bacterium]|nr:hypothetical protein [Chlorobiota bacterium]